MVLVALASANRAPEYFPQPDRLILSRERNHHIAFGMGIHHCLGAPLARLEGRIAIGTLLRRRTRMKLAVPPEQIEWQPTYLMRGFASVPLEFQ